MDFFESVNKGLSRREVFNYRTRASRSEYWYWILFGFLGEIVIFLFDAFIFRMPQIRPLGILFSLAIIIPNISVTARRLHDINRSGWWQLLFLIMLLPSFKSELLYLGISGVVVLAIYMLLPGKEEKN